MRQHVRKLRGQTTVAPWNKKVLKHEIERKVFPLNVYLRSKAKRIKNAAYFNPPAGALQSYEEDLLGGWIFLKLSALGGRSSVTDERALPQTRAIS